MMIAVKKPATEEQAQMLEQEALTMVGLDDPAIPKAHFWVQPESGGLRCLGMEYIPGCTLDSWLWCVLITCWDSIVT